MIYLNLRNIMFHTFTIVLFFVLITGCGNDESEKDSHNNMMNENKNGNTGMTHSNEMTQSNEMSSKDGYEHAMIILSTMQCDICKENIETAVKKLDGIESIDVVTKEKIAHINFDKSKTDLSKIESSITAAGYDANDKKADPEAYKELDDCCKLPKDQKKKY
ncbi:MAG: heavy-metal-associated domain-containing protein [Ignavibacteria bacterium]|nr:heavy-metal-associated domain-containing protein [Ignavibacteria bacterium]